MKKLYGHVYGKNGELISGADIEIKNSHFETIYHALSNESGEYSIEVPEAVYPFITCVRDYASRYLEYWCQNADLNQDLELNPMIDTLEVYGVHPFKVLGAYDAYMIYFRPMDLFRFQRGLPDIFPEIERAEVSVNGREASVMLTNSVKEAFTDKNGTLQQMGALLLQVKNPLARVPLQKLEIKVWDTEGHLGMADYFPTK